MTDVRSTDGLITARAHDPSNEAPSTRSRSQVTRKEFLRLILAGAIGTGLAAVGVLSPARRAMATHSTPSTTSLGCYGPTRTGHSLYGGTGCCGSCGSIVSSTHCGSDNWARHHNTASYEYRLRQPPVCRGKRSNGTTEPSPGKNAWFWTRSDTGHVWRCSDGHRRPLGSTGSWSKLVCPYDTNIT